MENRSHAIAAGLFMVLAILASLWLFWWFAGRHEATRELLIVSHRPVTGLNPHGQVRFRGVRVGKIAGIDFDRQDIRRILVRVRVRADLPLTRGSFAELEQQGVTGLAHVQLNDDGSNREPLVDPANGPPVLEMRPGTVQRLTEAAQALMDDLRGTATSVRQLASAENVARASSALSSLAATANELNTLAGTANQAMARVARLTSADNLRRIEATVAAAEAAGREAAPAMEELRGAIAAFRGLAQTTQALGQRLNAELPAGTGGEVTRLMGDLQRSSARLEQVLGGLEEAPQRLLLGPPAAAPGPGEPGFTATLPARRGEP